MSVKASGPAPGRTAHRDGGSAGAEDDSRNLYEYSRRPGAVVKSTWKEVVGPFEDDQILMWPPVEIPRVTVTTRSGSNASDAACPRLRDPRSALVCFLRSQAAIHGCPCPFRGSDRGGCVRPRRSRTSSLPDRKDGSPRARTGTWLWAREYQSLVVGPNSR